MATTHDPKAGGSGAGPVTSRQPLRRRFRWTREQYRRIAKLGFFEDRHVELLFGDVLEMTTNPPHDTAVGLASQVFAVAFGPGFAVRAQMTLDLGRRSMPVPDIAIVPGGLRDYATTHPTSALLIVEVSDSTLRKDRILKTHLYAHAGIADYWIVNLVDRQLEIRRHPGPDPNRRGRFAYADVTVVPADGFVSPLAAPGARIAVADLLP
jgi:Uma2 family endonuclease